MKIIEKKEENPDFCHQYGNNEFIIETIYRKSFLGEQKPVCPAKVAL